MSDNLQQAIQRQVLVLSEDEKRRVYDFMQNLQTEKKNGHAKPISAIFENLSDEISLDEWKELPSDGAENHDHYLYGSPRKPE